MWQGFDQTIKIQMQDWCVHSMVYFYSLALRLPLLGWDNRGIGCRGFGMGGRAWALNYIFRASRTREREREKSVHMGSERGFALSGRDLYDVRRTQVHAYCGSQLPVLRVDYISNWRLLSGFIVRIVRIFYFFNPLPEYKFNVSNAALLCLKSCTQ